MMQLALYIRQERARFAGQCASILGRLQRGRASNTELYEIARNATGRISELRKRNHDIRVIDREYKSGVVWYALFVDGKEAP